MKWKRQPMDRYLRSRKDCIEAWEKKELVTRCIDIDAGETRRRKLPPDDRWFYRYPLVEWGWDRESCIDAIKDAGLPMPGKSACFFCPAARKSEVLDLAKNYPDLFARAVAIERNSAAHTIKGLGRSYSWEDLVRKEDPSLVPEVTQLPCDCHEGEED